MGLISLIISISCLLVSEVYAQSTLLLVDRSGSMKPYFEKGVVQDLTREFQNVLQDKGKIDLAVFSSEVYRIQSITSHEFTFETGRSFTLMDRALDYALKGGYKSGWMITDNIQDEPGSPSVGNTERFYQTLKQEKVHSVVVFPVTQSTGHPGLVIYGLLFDPQQIDQFVSRTKQLSEKLKVSYGTEPLRLKPLDENTLETVVEGSGSQTKPYQEGQEVRVSFTVRLRSKFDHLRIVDAKIVVPEAQPGFGKDSLLVPEKLAVDVTPTAVKSLEPGAETQSLYSISVDLGKISLKKGLSYYWQAAWKSRGEHIPIDIVLSVDVPKGNFGFKKSFIEKYGAKTIELAKASGKIYAIESLPQLLQDRVTSIRVGHRVLIRINYPWWPSVLIIFLFLLLAIGVIAGAWAMRRFNKASPGVYRWTVVVQANSGASRSCKIGNKGEVIDQDQLLGTISGHQFQTGPGLQLEAGKGPITLEHGLRLRCLRRGGSFLLVFSAQAGADAQQMRTPTRRRK